MGTNYSNAKFLTILDPLPLENLGWEAVAYDVTNDGDLTVMQRVYRAPAMTGSKVRNDFGVGSITIPKEDPLWTTPLPSPLTGVNPLNREFLWRFFEDGVLRHEFFGEDIVEGIADEPPMVTIAGRTPEKLLEGGVHVPAWAETQSVSLSDDADEGTFILRYAKEKSDPIAHNASAAAFKSAILAGITALDGADLDIYKEVKGGERTWYVRFVGQFILGNAKARGFRAGKSTVKDGTDSVDIEISDIEQVDFYADPEPRTAASAFLDVLARCKARGVLNLIEPLFTAETDSFGEAWDDNDVHEVNGGETLLSLLQRFSEAYGWEFRMLPGFKLQVVQAGFGLDHSNDVRFWLGGHQITHELSRTSRDVMALVWAQTDKNYIASASGTSTATSIVREAWIDGFSGKAGYAQKVATKTLSERLNQVKQRAVKLPYNVDDKHRLFVDFTYCDTIGVEDDKNVIHPLKIESVSWSVGPESPIDFEVTFLGE